jgi:hypothetical protein
MPRGSRHVPTAAERAGALLMIAALLAGCSRTIVGPELQRNPDSRVEAAYIATDADFGRYDRLTGAEMGIFFPTNSRIPADDLDRMRQVFREAFLDELSGYRLVDAAGPGVLLVDASLIDLRTALYNDIPDLRREVQPLAKPGSLVFLMELKDSETGTVLGRAADSSLNPEIGTDDIEGSEWEAVEAAAQYWASLFRQFLDQNFATRD